jgi:hypothetical protein
VSDREEILALPVEEASRFLDQLGVIEAFNSGDLCCSVCDEPLKSAGLAAGRIDAGRELVFVCRHLDCQETFHAAA